jgi:DNA-binding MarR family transcriptional regulator
LKTENYIERFAKIIMLYNSIAEKACLKFKMNRTCYDILIYLGNHPEEDTARSLVEKRMIKKAMASVAIDQLCRMELLIRYTGKNDRRIQHLKLTEKAAPVTEYGIGVQQRFQEKLISVLSPKEMNIYEELSNRIEENLKNIKIEENL